MKVIKLNETDIKRIVKRVLSENTEGIIPKLRDDNPSNIDLSQTNFGRELKRNGFEPLDVDLGNLKILKRGKDASWKIKDVNTKGGNNLAILFSSGVANTPQQAVNKAFKNMSISYYQPNSEVRGLVPIFKIHRDDPNVPNKPGTLTITSEGVNEKFAVLQEKDGKFKVILIKPYKVIKSKYDPLKDRHSPEYKSKYIKSNDDDEDMNFEW